MKFHLAYTRRGVRCHVDIQITCRKDGPIRWGDNGHGNRGRALCGGEGSVDIDSPEPEIWVVASRAEIVGDFD
jgi:hypothetical protein